MRKRRKENGEKGVLVLTNVSEGTAFLLQGLFWSFPRFWRAKKFPGGKIYDVETIELSEAESVISLSVVFLLRGKKCVLL